MSFRYDPSHRPTQPAAPPADAFTIHKAVVAPGVSLAFVHESIGGMPLLLVHGYPETKRIWWRNIEALAASGFEVIAPDLRGMGDSDLPPDDQHDIAPIPATCTRWCTTGSSTHRAWSLPAISAASWPRT